MLNRVRSALGRSPGQAVPPLPEPILRFRRSTPEDKVARFRTAFESLAGKCITVPDIAHVSSALSERLAGKRVVLSNAPFLRECAIPGERYPDRDALRAACAAADIGITSADFALAETGTLVMISSDEEARLVSLLPPVHIAIFPRERLLDNLDEFLTLSPRPTGISSATVLITGPSRTGDIEQILVRGVHGPGEIYVVIVG